MYSENYLPGDFIGCVGDLRKGKTMNAVRIARSLHRRGYRVASNIPIVFADTLVQSFDDFIKLRDCVFVWDEIQASLDSRNSKSMTVMALTQESIYIGKRGIILIYTSPSLRMVDIRYRELTRNIYQMTRKALVRGKWRTRVEWCYQPVGSDQVLMPIGVFALQHERYYGLYDTLWGRETGQSLVIA